MEFGLRIAMNASSTVIMKRLDQYAFFFFNLILLLLFIVVGF